jgi:hypothetical protein
MGKSKKRRSPSPEWKNLEAQCLWPEQIAYEIIRPCQNWRIYAEEGLARRPADLWIYHDTLSIQFTTTLLAQYAVHYQTASHRLLEVGTYQAFPLPINLLSSSCGKVKTFCGVQHTNWMLRHGDHHGDA